MVAVEPTPGFRMDFDDLLNRVDLSSSPPPQSPTVEPSIHGQSPPESPLLTSTALDHHAPAHGSQELVVHGTDTTLLKRTRQGQLQFLDGQAIQKKLKLSTKEELRKYILAPDAEREVMMAANVFAIRDALASIETSTVAFQEMWEVPEKIQRNIKKYALRILLSPVIAEYDGAPALKLLMDIVERKLCSGLSKSIRHDDDGKWDKLTEAARYALTQFKSSIKKTISKLYDHSEKIVKDAPCKSGQDIITLCKHLTQIGKKSAGTTNLLVTAEMCGRIARYVMIDKPDSVEYWADVDKKLARTREMGKNDPKKISKLILASLDEDRRRFPTDQKSIVAISHVQPNVIQAAVDQALEKGDINELANTQGADADE
ncbi:hypothetical protein B0H21DRAFT_841753 [Amylocystis lapponica]|nr:hypothetical protein B0H21DRAFT_841753 [Amylocystis lapponica]